MNVEFPESFSPELKDLLSKMLERKPEKRLGCQGRGAEEVKSHEFFASLDWNAASKVRLPPPVVPPKGEVNAADAFDIGNFNEEDTKGVKVTKEDDDHYKNFDIFLTDRWQKEIVGELKSYVYKALFFSSSYSITQIYLHIYCYIFHCYAWNIITQYA